MLKFHKILEKYKMINTSILEEIVHNDKESDVIKDFAYEALYPDEVDRKCIKEITKYFGYSKDDDYYSTLKTFLNNINFDIKKGEFVGILGSNCSGKTTLLNLIKGNLNSNNSIQINETQKDPYYISIIDLKDDFYSKTILDELIEQNNSSSKNITSLLKNFGLYKFINKSPQDLTYFESQKLKFIKCIINNSKIILMDSVFSLLNKHEKLEFLSIIKKYQYELKLTIIYTTTNFDDIIFCDKLLIINNKQIVCENIENVCKSNYVKESNINIPLFYELNDKLKLYDLTSDNVTTVEEMVDELCN